ncbi:MAG: hypothetical protein HY923_01555 [Elusimicrobia bacterium]|nr:hypothetical protein [Elusimicrobiota bacterium]
MASTRREDVPAEVRRAVEQFDLWRAGKQGRERIPARLWEAAAKLCGAHSLHRVARWLGLNHTALRDRRAGRSSGARPSRPKPAFVEWSLPVGALPRTSSAEYVFEMGGGGAQRIHVRGASVGEVAALARALKNDWSAG